MTPTLRFEKNDTRATALAKAGAWYDRIVDAKMSAFATAIGNAELSPDDMLAGIQFAQVLGAEGRAPFLAEVGRVLERSSLTGLKRPSRPSLFDNRILRKARAPHRGGRGALSPTGVVLRSS